MERFVESLNAWVWIDPRFCCKDCKASFGSENDIVRQIREFMKRCYSPTLSERKCNWYKVTRELMSLKCGESEHRIIMENLAEIQRGYRMLHVGSISGLKNQLPQMWHANEWILFRANNNQISRRQHCMKLSEDRRLLSTYTLTWLSVSISTVQPRNQSCHTFKDTRMVSNSNWLMFSLWRAIKGRNGAWKNSPKQTAPQASRQASHANKLGLETVTFVGMTETPL